MSKEQFVLVTTDKRGVFAGVLEENNVGEDGTVVLREARNCIYWDSGLRGFLGLANPGPGPECRIGPAVPLLTLTGVTGIAECTDDARKAWESEPWG
jgi:hypothetical protein